MGGIEGKALEKEVGTIQYFFFLNSDIRNLKMSIVKVIQLCCYPLLHICLVK